MKQWRKKYGISYGIERKRKLSNGNNGMYRICSRRKYLKMAK